MEITSVKVKKEEREGSRMKGRASVLIDDGLAIHNIRIVENENGEMVTVHRDTVHPINPEVRAMFEEAILKAYNEAE